MSSIEKWYHAANGRSIREISSSEKINKLQSLYQASVFGKSGHKFNITHEIYYAPSACNEDKHSYITTVLLNMARLEHERWVAKSLLQGLMINPVDPCKKCLLADAIQTFVPGILSVLGMLRAVYQLKAMIVLWWR